MKILIVSDTHGHFKKLYKVVLEHDNADYIIHLGDCDVDIKEIATLFPSKQIKNVCGNCDRFSDTNAMQEFTIDGVSFFITHGDAYGVKQDTTLFWNATKQRGATIGLFGHTHKAIHYHKDGVHIFNPGSLALPRGQKYPTYGILELNRTIPTFTIHELKEMLP
ncbi:MAG: metallophosphoesterase [Oscillospiraceae bacterium]